MPDRNDFEFRAPMPFLRWNHPAPLRAEYYEGDEITVGSRVYMAQSALLAINNVTRSKGVIAGPMDGIPDVGIGGRSDARHNVGVHGYSKDGTGVHCVSETYEALHAETSSTETAAIAAYQMNADSTTAALFAKHAGNGAAAVFDGNVWVTGDIILQNADFAEDFDIDESEMSEPGTVMVFSETGSLVPSKVAYDKRVAGVISGAGSYKPGIILDKQADGGLRKAVGLLGKVYCKVDANFGAIEVGDLLTSSPTLGHAMRAEDFQKGFGAILGKALKPLDAGTGLIPILVTLQ